MRDEEVVLAVSFDIANAFNSFPWPVIRNALADKEIPQYLRHVLDGYLSDRWLSIEMTNTLNPLGDAALLRVRS